MSEYIKSLNEKVPNKMRNPIIVVLIFIAVLSGCAGESGSYSEPSSQPERQSDNGGSGY